VIELDTITGVQEYRIVRLIARGGMGAVYEAQQHGPEGFFKTVAIKTIRGGFVAEPEFVRLFIGEAKLVADLVHENIVQVLSLGASDGRYYIVMEYVEGITLEELIRYHLDCGLALPVTLGAFIISRVCRGLEYAHQRVDRSGHELRIVHRDISPKNVLLNVEGVVKVTDFGIAKAREVMEQDERVLMGRLEYMAPEQAQRKETDRRSDLYSLGVVTYELLTGVVPPRGAGSLAHLHSLGAAVARPPQELRPDLPDELAAIVIRALQPQPDDRYQSAGEMGYALEYFLYRDGYGPTNVTLRDYLRAHFPRAMVPLPPLPPQRRGESALRVEHRADTLFGDLLKDPPR
jgi:serine/threonine protein kinase